MAIIKLIVKKQTTLVLELMNLDIDKYEIWDLVYTNDDGTEYVVKRDKLSLKLSKDVYDKIFKEFYGEVIKDPNKDLISREEAIATIKDAFSMGECYCDRASIVGRINMLENKYIKSPTDIPLDKPKIGKYTKIKSPVELNPENLHNTKSWSLYTQDINNYDSTASPQSHSGTIDTLYQCSECRGVFLTRELYCPNCHTYMDI